MPSQTLQQYIVSSAPYVQAATEAATTASSAAGSAAGSASTTAGLLANINTQASTVAVQLGTMQGLSDGVNNTANSINGVQSAVQGEITTAQNLVTSATAAISGNAISHELSGALGYMAFSGAPTSGTSDMVRLLLRSGGSATNFTNSGSPYEIHFLMRVRSSGTIFGLLGNASTADVNGYVQVDPKPLVMTGMLWAVLGSTQVMKSGGLPYQDFFWVSFAIGNGSIQGYVSGFPGPKITSVPSSWTGGILPLSTITSIFSTLGATQIDFADILITQPLTTAQRTLSAMPPREVLIAKFEAENLSSGVVTDTFGGPLSIALSGPGTTGAFVATP